MNIRQELFISILNMSITASYVAAGVILVRFILRKAPKIFSYALWAVVLFRLICPVSFSTTFSFLGLLNMDSQNNAAVLDYVPHDLGFMQTPSVQSGIASLDSAVNSSLPQATPTASVNPIQLWMEVISFIWIIGIVVLVCYSSISYYKIKKQLLTSTLIRDNIYESDQIGTAFVCGFLRPKIYVPVDVGDADLSYILEHERTHIRRKDYLIKPIAFFALILHWFNPLMWLSFSLMNRDMEMSCDESVLQRMSQEAKSGYSSSLLSLSIRRKRYFAPNPLAFGESHVKMRIKNVLNYKKPALWVIVLVVIAIAGLMVAFTTNPKHNHNAPNSYMGYSMDDLIANKTLYVGNNSKVVGLISAMSLPKGIIRNTVELQTASLPYGITINYLMKDSSNVTVKGAISGDAFYRNAIMLFSLIDNVGIINCKVADKTGKHAGALYSFTYTREMAEKLMGQDVRRFSVSSDTLKNLIDRITKASFGKNAVPQATVNKQVEKYLEIIVSSPMVSSNPNEYIKAHQKEYESILKLGDGALTYMFSQFEKGNNNGLKGYIMMTLCKELLGDRNKITNKALTPQQWYEALHPVRK